MKRLIALFLSLLLVLSLGACANQKKDSQQGETETKTETESKAETATRTITDAAGRQLEVPEKVERVVCVGVGALRYTCYMQGQDLVVGVEDYETKPGMSRLYNYVNFDKFKDLPVIGGNGDPYVEEIIRVNPQVIVLGASANVEADDLQTKTGIPVVTLAYNDTALEDATFDTFRILGELFGKEERAKELSEYLEELQKDMSDRTAGITDKPSVYVGGVSFKGAHGFEGTEANYGPFQLAGADNLADTTGQKKAFDIDKEQVLTWDPDVIFLDFNGMELIREDYSKNPDFYNSLTAVKEGRVYSQISFRSYAVNLDTMLADGYYVASVLYPEQFADVDMEEKAGEIFTKLLGSNPYDDLKEAGYEFRAITIGE